MGPCIVLFMNIECLQMPEPSCYFVTQVLLQVDSFHFLRNIPVEQVVVVVERRSVGVAIQAAAGWS